MAYNITPAIQACRDIWESMYTQVSKDASSIRYIQYSINQGLLRKKTSYNPFSGYDRDQTLAARKLDWRKRFRIDKDAMDIGAVPMSVPATNIQMVNQKDVHLVETIRTPAPSAIRKASETVTFTLTLVFPDANSINNVFRHIMAEITVSPVIPIRSRILTSMAIPYNSMNQLYYEKVLGIFNYLASKKDSELTDDQKDTIYREVAPFYSVDRVEVRPNASQVDSLTATFTISLVDHSTFSSTSVKFLTDDKSVIDQTLWMRNKYTYNKERKEDLDKIKSIVKNLTVDTGSLIKQTYSRGIFASNSKSKVEQGLYYDPIMGNTVYIGKVHNQLQAKITDSVGDSKITLDYYVSAHDNHFRSQFQAITYYLNNDLYPKVAQSLHSKGLNGKQQALRDFVYYIRGGSIITNFGYSPVSPLNETASISGMAHTSGANLQRYMERVNLYKNVHALNLSNKIVELPCIDVGITNPELFHLEISTGGLNKFSRYKDKRLDYPLSSVYTGSDFIWNNPIQIDLFNQSEEFTNESKSTRSLYGCICNSRTLDPLMPDYLPVDLCNKLNVTRTNWTFESGSNMQFTYSNPESGRLTNTTHQIPNGLVRYEILGIIPGSLSNSSCVSGLNTQLFKDYIFSIYTTDLNNDDDNYYTSVVAVFMEIAASLLNQSPTELFRKYKISFGTNANKKKLIAEKNFEIVRIVSEILNRYVFIGKSINPLTHGLVTSQFSLLYILLYNFFIPNAAGNRPNIVVGEIISKLRTMMNEYERLNTLITKDIDDYRKKHYGISGRTPVPDQFDPTVNKNTHLANIHQNPLAKTSLTSHIEESIPFIKYYRSVLREYQNELEESDKGKRSKAEYMAYRLKDNYRWVLEEYEPADNDIKLYYKTVERDTQTTLFVDPKALKQSYTQPNNMITTDELQYISKLLIHLPVSKEDVPKSFMQYANTKIAEDVDTYQSQYNARKNANSSSNFIQMFVKFINETSYEPVIESDRVSFKKDNGSFNTGAFRTARRIRTVSHLASFALGITGIKPGDKLHKSIRESIAMMMVYGAELGQVDGITGPQAITKINELKYMVDGKWEQKLTDYLYSVFRIKGKFVDPIQLIIDTIHRRIVGVSPSGTVARGSQLLAVYPKLQKYYTNQKKKSKQTTTNTEQQIKNEYKDYISVYKKLMKVGSGTRRFMKETSLNKYITNASATFSQVLRGIYQDNQFLHGVDTTIGRLFTGNDGASHTVKMCDGATVSTTIFGAFNVKAYDSVIDTQTIKDVREYIDAVKKIVGAINSTLYKSPYKWAELSILKRRNSTTLIEYSISRNLSNVHIHRDGAANPAVQNFGGGGIGIDLSILTKDYSLVLDIAAAAVEMEIPLRQSVMLENSSPFIGAPNSKDQSEYKQFLRIFQDHIKKLNNISPVGPATFDIPMMISNNITAIMGIKHCVISGLQFSTIPDSPGSIMINISLLGVNSNLKEFETPVYDQIKFNRRPLELLLSSMASNPHNIGKDKSLDAIRATNDMAFQGLVLMEIINVIATIIYHHATSYLDSGTTDTLTAEEKILGAKITKSATKGISFSTHKQNSIGLQMQYSFTDIAHMAILAMAEFSLKLANCSDSMRIDYMESFIKNTKESFKFLTGLNNPSQISKDKIIEEVIEKAKLSTLRSIKDQLSRFVMFIRSGNYDVALNILETSFHSTRYKKDTPTLTNKNLFTDSFRTKLKNILEDIRKRSDNKLTPSELSTIYSAVKLSINGEFNSDAVDSSYLDNNFDQWKTAIDQRGFIGLLEHSQRDTVTGEISFGPRSVPIMLTENSDYKSSQWIPSLRRTLDTTVNDVSAEFNTYIYGGSDAEKAAQSTGYAKTIIHLRDIFTDKYMKIFGTFDDLTRHARAMDGNMLAQLAFGTISTMYAKIPDTRVVGFKNLSASWTQNSIDAYNYLNHPDKLDSDVASIRLNTDKRTLTAVEKNEIKQVFDAVRYLCSASDLGIRINKSKRLSISNSSNQRIVQITMTNEVIRRSVAIMDLVRNSNLDDLSRKYKRKKIIEDIDTYIKLPKDSSSARRRKEDPLTIHQLRNYAFSYITPSENDSPIVNMEDVTWKHIIQMINAAKLILEYTTSVFRDINLVTELLHYTRAQMQSQYTAEDPLKQFVNSDAPERSRILDKLNACKDTIYNTVYATYPEGFVNKIPKSGFIPTGLRQLIEKTIAEEFKGIKPTTKRHSLIDNMFYDQRGYPKPLLGYQIYLDIEYGRIQQELNDTLIKNDKTTTGILTRLWAVNDSKLMTYMHAIYRDVPNAINIFRVPDLIQRAGTMYCKYYTPLLGPKGDWRIGVLEQYTNTFIASIRSEESIKAIQNLPSKTRKLLLTHLALFNESITISDTSANNDVLGDIISVAIVVCAVVLIAMTFGALSFATAGWSAVAASTLKLGIAADTLYTVGSTLSTIFSSDTLDSGTISRAVFSAGIAISLGAFGWKAVTRAATTSAMIGKQALSSTTKSLGGRILGKVQLGTFVATALIGLNSLTESLFQTNVFNAISRLLSGERLIDLQRFMSEYPFSMALLLRENFVSNYIDTEIIPGIINGKEVFPGDITAHLMIETAGWRDMLSKYYDKISTYKDMPAPVFLEKHLVESKYFQRIEDKLLASKVGTKSISQVILEKRKKTLIDQMNLFLDPTFYIYKAGGISETTRRQVDQLHKQSAENFQNTNADKLAMLTNMINDYAAAVETKVSTYNYRARLFANQIAGKGKSDSMGSDEILLLKTLALRSLNRFDLEDVKQQLIYQQDDDSSSAKKKLETRQALLKKIKETNKYKQSIDNETDSKAASLVSRRYPTALSEFMTLLEERNRNIQELSQLTAIYSHLNSGATPLQMAEFVHRLFKPYEGAYTDGSFELLNAKFRESLRNTAKQDETNSGAAMYPAFKLYFIEEDNKALLMFNDFFSYASLKSIDVYHSRKQATSIAIIQVTNAYGNLTNIHSAKNANENPFLGPQTKNEDLNSIMIKPGCMVQVRLGYRSVLSSNEIVFSGEIVSVEGEEILTITCQGYGSRLTKTIGTGRGKNFGGLIEMVNRGIHKVQNLIWAIMSEADSLDRLGHFTPFGNSDEILNDNTYSWSESIKNKILLNITNSITGSLAGLTSNGYIDTRMRNILVSERGSLGHAILMYKWYAYNETIWDSLQDLSLQTSNSILTTRPYDDEETIIFAEIDDYYQYTDDYKASNIDLMGTIKKLRRVSNSPTECIELIQAELYDYYVGASKINEIVMIYFITLISMRKRYGDYTDLAKEDAYTEKFDTMIKELHTRGDWKTVREHVKNKLDDQTLRNDILAALYGAKKYLKAWEISQVHTNPRKDSTVKGYQSMQMQLYNEAKKKLEIGSHDLKVKNFQLQVVSGSIFVNGDIASLAVWLVLQRCLAASPQHRPISRTHFKSTDTNIVQNNITLEDGYNKVEMSFVSKNIIFDLTDMGTSPAKIVTNHDKHRTIEVQASSSIRPSKIRTYSTFQKNAASRELIRTEKKYVVANKILSNLMKDYYGGDLKLLGDPYIFPHDKIYIQDQKRDMWGVIGVESVHHTFSKETGFVTSIVPDLVTDMRLNVDDGFGDGQEWVYILSSAFSQIATIVMGYATFNWLGKMAATGYMKVAKKATFGFLRKGTANKIATSAFAAGDADALGSMIFKTSQYNVPTIFRGGLGLLKFKAIKKLGGMFPMPFETLQVKLGSLYNVQPISCRPLMYKGQAFLANLDGINKEERTQGTWERLIKKFNVGITDVFLQLTHTPISIVNNMKRGIQNFQYGRISTGDY